MGLYCCRGKGSDGVHHIKELYAENCADAERRFFELFGNVPSLCYELFV